MAEVEYDSKRSLRDQGIISSYEQLRAETARDLARSKTELARSHLERCRVRAPFDGVVAERWAQVGRRVEESEDSPLFRIVAEDPPRARVDIPEERLSHLTLGAASTIEASGYPTSVPARVIFVSPAVDPSSGTAAVIVQAQSAGGAMRPGVSARVRFHGLAAFRHDAFRVPRAAAPDGAAEGTEATLLVVDGTEVTVRRVKVLESRLGSVLVTGEIAPEDRVILGPPAGLKPGDPVVAVEEAL